MELNKNDAAVCTESSDPQTGKVSAVEINLYEELIAFAELPPEDYAKSESSPEVSSEPKAEFSDNLEECPRLEFLLTPAPVPPGTFVEEADRAAAEHLPENTSPEKPLPVSIESDESGTAASETANESVDTIDVQALLGRRPRPSGPLSGFNLPAEIVYTGALSRGVCVACGAESNADDLFCLTCGDFMDGTATTFPSNPTCGECQHRIDADEIFCPWCGSAIRVRR